MTRLFLTLLLTLVSAPAWAFPTNAVLDTFAGCTDTTTPPNSNWTNTVIFGATSSTVDCEDLAITSTGGATAGDAYWNVSQFGPNQEMYATLTAGIASTLGAYLCTRLHNIGANTTDGYCVLIDNAVDTIYINRVDDGVASAALDSTAQTITGGDSFGISAIGSRICSWYKTAAGSWTEIDCVTDTTYAPALSNLGVVMYGTSASVGQLDNIGGGLVPVARGGPIFLQ